MNYDLIKIKNTVLEKHNNNDDIKDLNYCFLECCFSALESNNEESLGEINERNINFNLEATAYYYNEDESLLTIYLSYYNHQLEDYEVISHEIFNDLCEKLDNIIKISKSGKYTELNECSILYDICDTIYTNKDNEILLNIVTNYEVPSSLNTYENYEIDGITIGRRVYDINHIIDRLNTVDEKENNLNLIEKFNSPINGLLISSSKDLDIYLTCMPGNWLASLYKDDSVRLLSANVRSYLKKTNKVNKEIINTVKEAPTEFVAYNNGISAISTSVQFDSIYGNMVTITNIDNFQIVNGGQTTASLYECMNGGIIVDKVLVPVKLSVIKNENSLEELTSNISTFSNFQSAIKKSDPPSNNEFFKKIEEMSINILANKDGLKYHCFFERTAGQYNTYLRMYYKKTDKFKINNPEKARFNKIQMAQAIMSWEQMPNMVSSGQEKNFTYFYNVVKDLPEFVNEAYFKSTYALIILYRSIDNMIKKQKLLYKSNVVTYTIALLSKYTNKEFDLTKIWEKQRLDEHTELLLNDMIKVVYNKLIDSPKEYLDIRMWARKKECWDSIMSIELNYEFDLIKNNVEFFPVKTEKIYIENNANLCNPVLWKMLNIWDDDNNILSQRQKRFIKDMPVIIYNNKMTKKQAEYAKSLFLSCAKAGFNYEGII